MCMGGTVPWDGQWKGTWLLVGNTRTFSFLGLPLGWPVFSERNPLCPEGLNVVLAFESKKQRGQDDLSIQPAVFSLILLVLDVPHFVFTCA